MSFDKAFLEILACAQCRSPLRAEPSEWAEGQAPDELVCTSKECGLIYPVRDGIPVLLIDEARRPGTPTAHG